MSVVICVICCGVGFILLKEFLGIFIPKETMKSIGLLFTKQKEIIDESDTPQNIQRKINIERSKITIKRGWIILGVDLLFFAGYFILSSPALFANPLDKGLGNPCCFFGIIIFVIGLPWLISGYVTLNWHKSHYGTEKETKKILQDLKSEKSLKEISETDYNRETDVIDEIEEFGQKAMYLHKKVNSIIFHEKSYMMQDYRFKENVERLLDLLEVQKEKLEKFERSMNSSSEERNQ